MNHRTLIARIAHEVNRAYCISIGDMSQPTWDEAPAWQKSSALNGVVAHMKQDLTPEQSHESWMEEKRAAGWRWGPFKDAEAKVHPCFTEYALLPQEQQAKDHLFKAVVDSFKAHDAANPAPAQQDFSFDETLVGGSAATAS